MSQDTNYQFSFSQKFIRGESRYGFWSVVSKGFGFLNALITLASLTLYQYGIFQLLLSLYGAASYFTSIGNGVVDNDISHFIREKKEGHAKKLFYQYNAIRISASVILWAAFFFGASLFSEKYSIEFIREIRIISFLFLTEVFFTATESLLVTRLNFAVAASRSAVSKIAQLTVLGYFLLFGEIGLREVLISVILSSLIATVTMIPAFARLYHPWRNTQFPKEKILFSIFFTYGKWDFYRQFINQVVVRIQPWLIKIFVNTEAVAIFSISIALINTIKDFAFPVKTLKSLVPLHMNDSKKTQKIFINSLRYIFLLSIVVSILALLGIPILVSTFFSQYIPSIPYFYLMLIGVPIASMGIITGIFIVALRKQKFLFLHAALRGMITVIFYGAFLPFYGLWALALERIVTPLIMLVITFLYIISVKPGVTLHFRDIFVVGKEDTEFFKMMWKDIRVMIRNKLEYVTKK